MKQRFTKTLLSTVLVCAAGGASAAAFQLAEVSTSGLGRAYAGEAAIADNASVVATNPALMTMFKRPEVSFGGVYVDTKVNLSGNATLINPRTGTPLRTQSANHNDVVPSSFVPNLYMVYPINDKFAIGGGANVNFGMRSEFDSDYSAGIFGGTTKLTAVNLNLSAAYKVLDNLSFGLGFNAVRADAKLERTLGMASQLYSLQLGRNIPASTEAAKLEDTAWGFGWNAGLVYEVNANNRFGFAYHSPVTIKFKDDSAYSFAAQRTATARLNLNLPGYLEFSGYHKMTEKLAVSYSYKFTDWRRFKQLKATYDSDGVTALEKPEHFNKSHRLALGVSYDVNDALTLRTGIAYDQTPIDAPYFSASIPDANRTWYSLGATYRITPDLSIDFGYAHLRASKNTFTEKEASKPVVVKYETSSKANLYGLNINYRF